MSLVKQLYALLNCAVVETRNFSVVVYKIKFTFFSSYNQNTVEKIEIKDMEKPQ